MSVDTALIKIDGTSVVNALQAVHESIKTAEGKVVLDFSSVPRIDVSAVRELEKLVGTASNNGTKVALRGVNVETYRVLKLTNLAERLSFPT